MEGVIRSTKTRFRKRVLRFTKKANRCQQLEGVKEKGKNQHDFKTMSHMKTIAFETLQYISYDDMSNPIISMKATADPDMMYLWQARQEPDYPKFQEAMQ
jgi:hypothetical protein